MQTILLLLTVYGTHAIPFEKFCKDFLGICGKTGRNRLAMGRFPVPLNASGMVDIRDVAEYLDKARAAACDRVRK